MLRTEQAIPAWPGWETERLIGRGSFGAVYEIRREVLGHLEKAALKYIRIPQSDSELDELMNDGYDAQSITERFEGYLHDIVREYALMADMKGCGNVVYCDDVRYIQHDNGIGWDIYIKMELLTPLPKALGKEISESEIIKIGADMCNALAFCEKRNLIHRDIKPANIFMAPDGMYKLGDFGIAKTAERTTSGTKTGTYKYMAPEVYNNQPYGTKADIYSLGLVLYWLLNERRTPFLPLPPTTPTSREEDGARNRRLRGEPLPPPAHGSPALQRVVLRACSYDPRDRYRNAEELLQALKNVEANPEGSAERTGFSGVPAEGRQTWDVRSEDATEGLLFSRTSADAKATRDTGGWTQGRRDPSFEESGHYDRPVREESETVGVYNGGVAGRSAERSTAKKTTAILLACGAAAVVLVLILLLLPR
jgi:serine/threonine protein kinase